MLPNKFSSSLKWVFDLKIGVGTLLIALIISLSGCNVEQVGIDYCADKGGVKGWSVRWGLNVVHCNNGDAKVVD